MGQRRSIGLRETKPLGIDISPISSVPPPPEWHSEAVFSCAGYPRRGCYSEELGLYVIAAQAFDSFACTLFSSPDGKNWTGGTTAGSGFFDVDHTNPFTHSPNFGSAWDVAWSPSLGLFVAVGGNHASGAVNTYAIVTSTDGLVWTRRGNPFAVATPYPDAKSVHWSEEQGIFVVGGSYSPLGAYPGPSNNVIATSPNGITWTTHSSPWNAATQSDFAVGGIEYSPELDLWVAIGGGAFSETTVICTSPDGATWTAQTTPIDNAFTSSFSDIAWSSSLGLFIATLKDIGIITSPDGITWTTRSTPADPFSGWGVCDDSGTIYASGNNADSTICLLKSSDAITWVVEPSPIDDPLGGASAIAYDVFISPTGAFALGRDAENNPIIASYY